LCFWKTINKFKNHYSTTGAANHHGAIIEMIEDDAISFKIADSDGSKTLQ